MIATGNMNELKITIAGNPATKKNSGQIVMRGKHPILLPSKTFLKWQDLAGWQLKGAKGLDIHTPVTVECKFYMETRRRVDLVNLLNAVDDMLVKYNVLQDDNSAIIKSHDGSRVFYDKNNPRCEITITEFEEKR